MSAPLSVFVNGRFLQQPLSGMQRYAAELVTALDARLASDPALAEELSVTVLVPPGNLMRRPDWSGVTIKSVGSFKGHLWEQVELGWHARTGILISLGSAGPLVHKRHIVAFHDANVFVNPPYFSRAYGILHRTLRPRLARRAARLVTISQFSADELSRWCGIPRDSFTLIHDSAEHIRDVTADPATLDRFGLTRGEFALAVGNQSPNKNVALAVEAMGLSTLALPLAVAGGGGAIFGAMKVLEGDRVRVLGRVTDGELRSLYEAAAVFIFPSRYEGFGVPPLEAMTLGCPVLSSDTSAMPEILGDAASYFHGDDAQSLAQGLDALSANPRRRMALVKKGYERSALYSWRNGAETLVDLIRSLSPGRIP